MPGVISQIELAAYNPEAIYRNLVGTRLEVASATSIELQPYLSGTIGLYTGSIWRLFEIGGSNPALANTDLDMDSNALAVDYPYDIFAYISGSSIALAAKKWTSATARATALVRQNGIWALTGYTTHRWLGTIYTYNNSAVVNFKDECTMGTGCYRYLWNKYNQIPKTLITSNYNAGDWTYNSVTWREAYGGTGQLKANFVLGEAKDSEWQHSMRIAGSTYRNRMALGYDRTNSTDSNYLMAALATGSNGEFSMSHLLSLGLGKHYVTLVESMETANTGTFGGYNDCRAVTILMM